MTPTALDIAIAGILFLSMLVAFFRGFIKEVFTLGGFVLAVYAAYALGHVLVPEFDRWFGVQAGESSRLVLGILSPALASKVFAYGGMFLLVSALAAVVGYLLARWVKDAGLSLADRLLGLAFGFARGFLLVFVVFIPFHYLIDQDKFPDWAKNSISVPVLRSTLAWSNRHLDLDKRIEQKDGAVSVRFEKINIDKLSESMKSAEDKLKEAVDRSEEQKSEGSASPPSSADLPAPPETPPAAPDSPPAPAPEGNALTPEERAPDAAPAPSSAPEPVHPGL